MPRDFSDRPLTVDGVTIRPKWPWSREYRAAVRAQVRAPALDNDIIGQWRAYAAWYAEKEGITVEEARQRLDAATAGDAPDERQGSLLD